MNTCNYTEYVSNKIETVYNTMVYDLTYSLNKSHIS